MNRTISIPADGSQVAVPLGVFKYLFIRSADVAFQISFDGWNWQPARQNDRYDESGRNPLLEKIYVMASGGLPATVTIAYDTKPFAATDVAITSESTSASGCGGSGIALSIAKAKAQGGADYNYNAGNPVDLTAANTVRKVPGVVNGKKRKTIYFDNRNSATDVAIFDGNGALWMRLAAGKDSPVFETSSDFYIGGLAGIAANFIYCETFYDLSNS